MEKHLNKGIILVTAPTDKLPDVENGDRRFMSVDIELTPPELARRWRRAVGTLKVWRCKGKGPKYNKRGSRVTYSLCDIEAFENANKICPDKSER